MTIARRDRCGGRGGGTGKREGCSRRWRERARQKERAAPRSPSAPSSTGPNVSSSKKMVAKEAGDEAKEKEEQEEEEEEHECLPRRFRPRGRSGGGRREPVILVCHHMYHRLCLNRWIAKCEEKAMD